MELIIKFKDIADFNILLPLLKRLGVSFREKTNKPKPEKNALPITFAKQPNFMALTGIWHDKNITAEQLRKEAWGNRI